MGKLDNGPAWEALEDPGKVAMLLGSNHRISNLRTRLFPSQRLLLAVLGFLGCMMVYSHRVDLSVTLICMVNQTAVNTESLFHNSTGSSVCAKPVAEDVSDGEEGPPATLKLGAMGTFLWGKGQQGLILSSFFWGYLLTQVLGGWAGQRYGIRAVFAGTVLSASLLTLITPLVARFSWIALVVLRVVLGLLQGATFPLVVTIWSNWAPPLERSTLSSITFAGCQVGNVITLPFAGVLCDHGFDGGWPSVFYLLGIAGIGWSALWWWLARNTPADSNLISAAEKTYILDSLSRNEDHDYSKVKMPWLRAFRRLPVWAAWVGHVCGDWGAYVMLTCLPSFMSDVLKFDLTSLGFLASIPYIAYFIIIQLSGVLADYVQRMGWLNTINTRRCAMIIGLGGQGAFLLAAGYCGCGQEYLVIVFLTIGMGLSGFQYSGFIVNYMDLAPLFSGFLLWLLATAAAGRRQLMGVGNTLACFSGIIAPAAMAAITPNKTAEEWRGMFWLTAGVLWFGAAFFCIFAKGTVEEWGNVEEKEMMETKTSPSAVPLMTDPSNKIV